jgi:hypothetical protein
LSGCLPSAQTGILQPVKGRKECSEAFLFGMAAGIETQKHEERNQYPQPHEKRDEQTPAFSAEKSDGGKNRQMYCHDQPKRSGQYFIFFHFVVF